MKSRPVKIGSSVFFLLLPVMAMLLSLTAAKANGTLYDTAFSSTLEGRWDMSINMGGKEVPSWLEVRHSGLSTLVGDFVGSGGSARPISKINFSGGKLSFTIPPQWETGNDVTVEGTFQDNNLSGTILWPDGKSYNWTAVRAPKLKRATPPVWGKPIPLLNGKDLSGWRPTGATNQWKIVNGVLTSPKSGSNLVTTESFKDFKLHIEFRYDKGSNSGVYLRGRYEVQIADNKGSDPLKDYFGAVYGFIAPSEMVAKNPGEWQTYDITLVGRMVTIIGNGKTIVCNQEIPGITGGAIDSKEGEPGPLLLQGDHGPIEFRNIVITPAK
jgi:hypothetical protein